MGIRKLHEHFFVASLNLRFDFKQFYIEAKGGFFETEIIEWKRKALLQTELALNFNEL